MRKPLPDLTGQRFTRLLVLRPSLPVFMSGKLRPAWKCLCDCGKTAICLGESLRTNHTKSCGCLHLEKNRTNNLLHGHNRVGKRSPEYKSWDAMTQRTSNPNFIDYKNYGGRGIAVCERWRKFENFLADMGARPDGMSLDRINNDGNYEPGNCRWATRMQQRQNARPMRRGYKQNYRRTPEHTAKLLASRRQRKVIPPKEPNAR